LKRSHFDTNALDIERLSIELNRLDDVSINDLRLFLEAIRKQINSFDFEGPQSNKASATPATVPSEPRNLQAVPDNSAVELNWTTPFFLGPGTIAYHLFRNGKLVWGGSAMEYNDTNVVNFVSYSYIVAAQNAVGW